MEQKIGKYSITDILGSGAFADVFLAEDPITKRKVAIKRCSAVGAKRESLLSECRLLVQLEHPNIVTVYDADLVGSHFIIIMEYMSGGSLEKMIKKVKVLTPEMAIKISVQILSAIHYAHSLRVIHRDIKPANILFTGTGKAKLSDFGVARVLETTKEEASTRIGTVPYMAPEQVLGRATFQSDIYAVGVVLYEMVTGVRAFDGDTDYIIQDKIVKSNFIPPRKVNPGVPVWLEDVILKAMSRDLSIRYKTAKEMAEALKQTESKVIIPDVLGMEEDKAKSVLEKKGLSVRVSYRDLMDRRLSWKTLSQVPDVGTEVSEGAEVSIIVGKYLKKKEINKKRKMLYKVIGFISVFISILVILFAYKGILFDNKYKVPVPDLTGMTVENANKKLTEIGFNVNNENIDGDSVIIEQSIPEGTILNIKKGYWKVIILENGHYETKIIEPAHIDKVKVPGNYETKLSDKGLVKIWVGDRYVDKEIPAKTEEVWVPEKVKEVWIENK